MSKLLRDCIVVPVPKPHKDPSLSDNYRPIALAPNLSNVLQTYSSSFVTTDLQFGFKPGFSTDLCTGVLKNVVSSYINCSRFCWTDSFPILYCVSSSPGVEIRPYQLGGTLLFLSHLASVMEFVRVVFFPPFCLPSICINCSQDFQHLKLAAILGITLWVHFVTLMILPFWLLHHQLFAFCC